MKQILIAMAAHGINRAYCESIGDSVPPAWDEATDAHRESLLAGVKMHLNNPDATPEQSHQAWLDQKVKEGWKYGETKEADKKLHPCILPYDELPQEQKSKDYLFRAVVHVLTALSEPISEDVKAQVLASLPKKATEAGAVVAENLIPVRYIGRQESWIEKRYKSGLVFSRDQVRRVPAELAKRLLRHADLFALAELEAGTEDPNDDTAEQIARAQDEAGKAKQVEVERQELVDQIMTMDKDALEVFARTQYRQEINKRRSLPNLREEVVGYVDQFGVV